MHSPVLRYISAYKVEITLNFILLLYMHIRRHFYTLHPTCTRTCTYADIPTHYIPYALVHARTQTFLHIKSHMHSYMHVRRHSYTLHPTCTRTCTYAHISTHYIHIALVNSRFAESLPLAHSNKTTSQLPAFRRVHLWR